MIRHDVPPASRVGGNGTCPIPSITTLNINSTSVTKPGGVRTRFFRVISLLAYLVLAHPIVCIQDIRFPTDSYVKQLEPLFPGYTFHVTANNSMRAGVLTIFRSQLLEDYHINSEVIFRGHILLTTFTHITSKQSFNVYNCYLHASDERIWREQVASIRGAATRPNSILLGDFNHVNDEVDRSGYHADKTKMGSDLFTAMLEETAMEEVYQPMHTWYGRNETGLCSSRIDRIYHNLDFTELCLFAPEIHALTTAPYTITQYGLADSGPSHLYRSDLDHLVDRQLITNYKTKSEGGTHVTDHVPLSLRFRAGQVAGKKSSESFHSPSLNTEQFKVFFNENFNRSHCSDDPISRYTNMQQSLIVASHRAKQFCTKRKTGDAALQDAIKLLNAVEAKDPEVQSKFAHIPEFLALADCPEKLLDKINLEFSKKAFDADTGARSSRLETIKRTLPASRARITALHDEADLITDDPGEMTRIAAAFWRPTWSKRPTRDPTLLFRLWGKKIQISPTPITPEALHDTIMGMGDSAAGPDTIPFAAYRAIVEVASEVLCDLILHIMHGNPPPPNFNTGILVLLPKKPTARIEDTRPLVVNNASNRIVAAAINASISPAVESILSDNQNGFRQNRSTATNIEYFNRRFYEALEHRKFYDLLLIDFKKAFDSISHRALFACIKAVGFSQNYCNAIEALFHEAHCLTSFPGSNPSKIHFGSGVKQGCPLSPTLFILIADVLDDMLSSIPGLEVRLFADDTAVGCENIIPRLRSIKATFETFRQFTGLQLNVTKTCVVSTGGRSQLRKALDAVGWQQVRISGNERYLGMYLGHETTLEHVFRPAFEKLQTRLASLKPLRKKYSVPSRVLIWNTWLLPILSYVSRFYLIPSDYLLWIDGLCSEWLSHGKTMKPLHLSRPTHLAGLATPLRDTALVNYASLSSVSDTPPRDPLSPDWSMRMDTHRFRAREHVVDVYGVDLRVAKTPTEIYRQLISSATMTSNFTNYVKDKLTRVGITNSSYYLQNCKHTPSWLPGYVRYTSIAISHNALLTASRMHLDEPCHLCGVQEDSSKHLFGLCQVARLAHERFWGTIGTTRGFSFEAAICAEAYQPSHIVTAQYMLSSSVWRARTHGYWGLQKSGDGWAEWICEDALSRIAKACPTFFNRNFPHNTVPGRHKVDFSGSIGNSRINRAEKNHAALVIDDHIRSLPTGTMFAFTDGSASPNPGPAGAGAAILQKTDSGYEVLNLLAAAIGHGTNNRGELFAIAMAAADANERNYAGVLHIYTDSKMAYGALKFGWSAGRDNASLLSGMRHQIRTTFRLIKFQYHWLPGHSNIALNDTADKLAAAGAAYSAHAAPGVLNLGKLVMDQRIHCLLIDS